MLHTHHGPFRAVCVTVYPALWAEDRGHLQRIHEEEAPARPGAGLVLPAVPRAGLLLARETVEAETRTGGGF